MSKTTLQIGNSKMVMDHTPVSIEELYLNGFAAGYGEPSYLKEAWSVEIDVDLNFNEEGHLAKVSVEAIIAIRAADSEILWYCEDEHGVPLGMIQNDYSVIFHAVKMASAYILHYTDMRSPLL